MNGGCGESGDCCCDEYVSHGRPHGLPLAMAQPSGYDLNPRRCDYVLCSFVLVQQQFDNCKHLKGIVARLIKEFVATPIIERIRSVAKSCGNYRRSRRGIDLEKNCSSIAMSIVSVQRQTSIRLYGFLLESQHLTEKLYYLVGRANRQCHARRARASNYDFAFAASLLASWIIEQWCQVVVFHEANSKARLGDRIKLCTDELIFC